MSSQENNLCPPEAKANGGCKKGTDVPLLPVSSSMTFKTKVDNLIEELANQNLEKIASVLNFAVVIFSMRHPKELRDLIDNLEAVERAKNGAVDGAIDPDPKSNEVKFKQLQEEISNGNVATMHKISVAAISLISMFHIDQLPMLMPIYVSLENGTQNSRASGGFARKLKDLQKGMEDMDIIKTVAIWAVGCFAKYHPDVVVDMGLVTKD